VLFPFKGSNSRVKQSKGKDMNINEVINVDNKFLKAPDLKGRKIAVRIESYTVEDFKDMRGGSKRQIVLKFRGAQKVLGLNKINTRMIASMYGEEADRWIGQEIILYPTKTQSVTGEIVDCVRIEYRNPEVVSIPPQPAPMPVQRPAPVARPQMSEMQQPQRYDERNPPPATSLADDMDDAVPF
jgi:hypothetical protein